MVDDYATGIVKDTLIQLELYKHRHKLAMSLSGGMKRKLCVAIALIGESRHSRFEKACIDGFVSVQVIRLSCCWTSPRQVSIL